MSAAISKRCSRIRTTMLRAGVCGLAILSALAVTAGGPAAATRASAAALADDAAELRRETIAAFDRYVAAAEREQTASLADPGRFLRLDRALPAARADALRRVRAGEVWVERLEARHGGQRLDIPGGQVHHWSGTAFLSHVSVGEAVALLQDYDRHAALFAPAVVRSRIVERQGDSFVVDLRFYQKYVISVTVQTRNDARFTRHDPVRVSSRIVSTEVREVENPGTPEERLKPEGQDGGYLWRLNTYWRFLERDGGTYIECESITLTRSVPAGFGWIIGKFVNRIPRESLTFTLDRTRAALAGQQTHP